MSSSSSSHYGTFTEPPPPSYDEEKQIARAAAAPVTWIDWLIALLVDFTTCVFASTALLIVLLLVTGIEPEHISVPLAFEITFFFTGVVIGMFELGRWCIDRSGSGHCTIERGSGESRGLRDGSDTRQQMV